MHWALCLGAEGTEGNKRSGTSFVQFMLLSLLLGGRQEGVLRPPRFSWTWFHSFQSGWRVLGIKTFPWLQQEIMFSGKVVRTSAFFLSLRLVGILSNTGFIIIRQEGPDRVFNFWEIPSMVGFWCLLASLLKPMCTSEWDSGISTVGKSFQGFIAENGCSRSLPDLHICKTSSMYLLQLKCQGWSWTKKHARVFQVLL